MDNQFQVISAWFKFWFMLIGFTVTLEEMERKKKTRKDKFRKCIIWLCIFNAFIGIFQNAFFYNKFADDPLKSRILGINGFIGMLGFFLNGLFRSYRPFIMEMMLNFKKFHSIENVFIKEICTKYFDLAYRVARFTMRMTPFAIATIVIAVSALGTVTTYYLEPSPYPMPFLVHLPYLPPTTTRNYIINLIQLEISTITVTMMCFIPFASALIAYIYTLLTFDAIADLIDKMMYVRRNASLVEWVRLVSEFLLDNKRTIDKIKVIQEKILVPFTVMCKLIMLSLWFILKDDRTFLSFLMGGAVVFVCVFALTFLNEEFVNKYDRLCDAIYNLPWYNLNPKEREIVSTLLLFVQNQRLESSIKGNFNLKWFTEVAKQAFLSGIISFLGSETEEMQHVKM